MKGTDSRYPVAEFDFDYTMTSITRFLTSKQNACQSNAPLNPLLKCF